MPVHRNHFMKRVGMENQKNKQNKKLPSAVVVNNHNMYLRPHPHHFPSISMTLLGQKQCRDGDTYYNCTFFLFHSLFTISTPLK